jgi:hypothetical protein
LRGHGVGSGRGGCGGVFEAGVGGKCGGDHDWVCLRRLK